MTESTPRDVSTNSTTSGGGGSTGFLSKITRSPSRRHKPLGSNDSIDATLSPPRPTPRPGYPRTTTAPAAIKADLISRASSDVSSLTLTDNMALPLPVPLLTNGSSSSRAPLYRIPSNNTNDGGGPVKTELDVASALAINGMLSANTVLVASNATTLYTHIQELANKRIATLDYLRKAHEGRSFWFNTVQFSEADIAKLPSYTPNRLSRRAVNYMLLGMSIPPILDLHPQPHPQSAATTSASIAQDYLKNLNMLLTEFESFQQLHPPDGSSAGSLSRARIPQMFKRATATSRPRKSSGPVTDIGLPMLPQTSSPPNDHGPQPSFETTTSGASFASSASTMTTASPSVSFATASFPTTSTFPAPGPVDAPNATLLPNEGPYTHLQTPPLPFTPDFFTVFATLCDVLIDTYQRLMQILTSQSTCTPLVGDLFTKVDGRIRKVMISVIVREFETASRENAKKELLGVQKVVLGGLMA
ncbi:hypothetical protein LTS07_002662 [Exophiala sideris]|uniref:Uncharacterized protein n=1 Tax=Exophiala sideris TaxID=1016849 RepID=A0ABR0JK98_9EURO|nr:hypothetical protein LTS07_002662 [Exophiala sideris]KAK5039422.1 hypothetical protein LTR13_003679 [Exophiala sideris]KAK5066150.1 hypothetical protein LTR69_002668 [Exophiala sideris]KAK5186827.1 hypothetical protein LTR44_000833 [Eurotiomycetes sp. CCFEE 6388]